MSLSKELGFFTSFIICKVLTTTAFAHRFAVTNLSPWARNQLSRGLGLGRANTQSRPLGISSYTLHSTGKGVYEPGGVITKSLSILGGPGRCWNGAYQVLTVLFSKIPPNHANIFTSTLGKIWKEIQQQLTRLPPKTTRRETLTFCFSSSVLFELFSISLYSSYKVFQRISLQLFWRNKQVHQEGRNRR